MFSVIARRRFVSTCVVWQTRQTSRPHQSRTTLPMWRGPSPTIGTGCSSTIPINDSRDSRKGVRPETLDRQKNITNLFFRIMRFLAKTQRVEHKGYLLTGFKISLRLEIACSSLSKIYRFFLNYVPLESLLEIFNKSLQLIFNLSL